MEWVPRFFIADGSVALQVNAKALESIVQDALGAIDHGGPWGFTVATVMVLPWFPWEAARNQGSTPPPETSGQEPGAAHP